MSDISPLFAIEAEELLNKGLTKDTIELCKSGLETFPSYASAYNILILAYEQSEDYESCLRTLEKALELFPLSKQIIALKDVIIQRVGAKLENLSEETENDFSDNNEINSIDETSLSEGIEKILNEQELNDSQIDLSSLIIQAANGNKSEERSKSTFLTSPYLKLHTNVLSKQNLSHENMRLIPGLEFTPLNKQTTQFQDIHLIEPLFEFPDFGLKEHKDITNISSLIDQQHEDIFNSYNFHSEHEELEKFDELKELAKRIEKATFSGYNQNNGNSNLNSSNFILQETKTSVASETMADIYEKQGAYDEAIKIYEILLEKHPEKFDYYKSKIIILKENY